MAKKTTSRSKSEPKAETAAPVVAPPPKPRARAKSTKPSAGSDMIVEGNSLDVTVLSVEIGPSDEDIRMRAYHRYLERGGDHGMDFEDWLAAERELRQRK